MAVDTSSLENELVEDLTSELSAIDSNFNVTAITYKVKNAIRDVLRARNYPESYKDTVILSDLNRYYSNIRNIALYDYNMIGAEGELSHSETGTSRSFIDRDKLFNGIVPISRLIS